MGHGERDDDRAGTAGQVQQTAFSTENSTLQQAARDIHNTHNYGALSFGVGAIVVAMILAIWAIWPDGQPDAAANGWREVLHRNDFVLIPRRICTDGVEDKVDLDTGQRGRGAQPQLPPCASDGGLADLILDETDIHTSSQNRRNILPVNRTTRLDADTCDSLIKSAEADLSASIPIDELSDGDQACVRTDKARIPGVTFARVPTMGEDKMLIDFVVWEKQ